MLAAEIKNLRKRHKLTQRQLAEVLNAALDRKYTDTEVGRWENGKINLPEHVSLFLDEYEVAAAMPGGDLPGLDDVLGSDGSPVEGDGDTAPPPPPAESSVPGPVGGQVPLSSGGAYARVCEEMWEMVATGVGLVGAATGSPVLQNDGRIILGDKKALGEAWGKLAETNATFRKMLAGMTSGGAAMQVAFVTGVTFTKLARNHQEYAQALRQQRLQEAEAAAGEAPPDGSVEGLLQQAA